MRSSAEHLQATREQLQKDVEDFIARGGHVQQIPIGASAHDKSKDALGVLASIRVAKLRLD